MNVMITEVAATLRVLAGLSREYQVKSTKNRMFKYNNVSSTSTGHFLYSLLPKNCFRAKIQHNVKLIAVRAIVGSLETFVAATRYMMT